MKTCPACHQTYPDEIESCPHDGSRLAPEFRDERECPYCAGKILKKARVCKHCGRDVEPMVTDGAPTKAFAGPSAAQPGGSRSAAAPARSPVTGGEPQFRLLSDEPMGGAPPRKMVSDRYSDAYTVANAIISTGEAVKVIGVALALAGAVAVVWWYFREAAPIFESFWVFLLLLCAVVGFGFWIVGVFITAQGQLLRALLDTAVNTSPFFSNTDKERIMEITQRTPNV
jgi:DNA-directed RNA polymerase subunit RPC12/RpoP